ncbi:MAG: DUF5009 domain-containing protein [Candidatus Marinimicrobia bacterium CG08_land_8_20_14_0_20_45_22]|nr:MAG: DUF5009 domain-containing protein [Candidatus Marinimicrobia bacterium CG08_land_8_20_14_0_20_45_22]
MDELLTEKPKRLISLDAFRGITIAGMILVNNPGNWGKIYPPLGHAHWHGWTPTDFIFPFFLFIVGVAIVYAFSNRLEVGAPRKSIYLKIAKRTAWLFGIGLYLSAFRGIPTPELKVLGGLLIIGLLGLYIVPRLSISTEVKEQYLKYIKIALTFIVILLAFTGIMDVKLSTLRIPGVLQRIAVTYAIASIIVLNTNIKWQAILAVAFLVIYWLAMKLIPVPGYGAGMLALIDDPTGNKMGNLAWYVDSILLKGHTWSGAPAAGFDPEGILSTIPAISTVLFGVLTAHWLKTKKNDLEKVVMLFVFGVIGLVVGEVMGIWFPINKNLWSPSYTVFMGGMALLFLAMCYWAIDIKGYHKWSKPFVIFGSNAIAVYALSSLTARALVFWWKVPSADGTPMALKTFLYQHYFESWASPYNASLLWALSYVLIWFIFVWILYRRKIFIKI